MKYSDFLDDDELRSYARSINSRARQAKIAGEISIIMLRDRIYESGGKCEWCTVSILHQAFEVDHIIALNRGGANTADNLAVACPDCNRAKSAKHAARFAQETYARTGIMTPLLQRVLDYYQADASAQKSLFECASDNPQISPDDSDPDDPPPYVWGK